MDLFEVLFILLFILFPIIEQVRKKGKQGKGPPGKPRTGTGAGDRTGTSRSGGSAVGAGSTGAEAGGANAGQRPSADASDMVPDDLWAVLTGEQRTPRQEQDRSAEPVAEEAVEERAVEKEAWSRTPDTRRPSWDAEIEAESTWEGKPAPWETDPIEEPESLEYQGPEAYSLERLDYDPVSMERPIPSPEARHRAFHARIDRPQVVRKRRKTIGRALRDPESLRNAFVLKEVLGKPKGLED